jgi:hypothetical protein
MYLDCSALYSGVFSEMLLLKSCSTKPLMLELPKEPSAAKTITDALQVPSLHYPTNDHKGVPDTERKTRQISNCFDRYADCFLIN